MMLKALRTALPDAEYMAIAPGRVNLLGEHVDYNGGAVLPAAIHRTIKVTAKPNSNRLVELHAVDLDESTTFSLDQLALKQDIHDMPLPGWAQYPAGVAHVLQSHGYPVTPIRAAFTSNIPMGSGLSSSAALEVAFGALWQEMGGWSLSRLMLARLCQEAENLYVGVNCGLMDQFASANGVEGHALYFNTHTLDYHPVPIPDDYWIVIADSNVRRKLTHSGYNDRRAACEEALAILQKDLPQIRTLADVPPDVFDQLAGNLPPIVEKRDRHVVEECDRVNRAVILLEAGDVRAFGSLMFETHRSLRDLYEVSIPELDRLVELAASLPGCIGARLTGAGFGGCTVNLVEASATEEFITRLKLGYSMATDRTADVFACRVSRGVDAYPWNWNTARMEVEESG